MTPEQMEMAKFFADGTVGNLNLEAYEESVTDLFCSCSDSYSKIADVFHAVSGRTSPEDTQNIYNIARGRDLRILHETYKRLPNLPNIFSVAASFTTHTAHMNTLEGMEALHAMTVRYYGQGEMVDKTAEVLESRKQHQNMGRKWKGLFNQPEIKPDEYMNETVLPPDTEYPLTLSNGVNFHWA